MTRGRGKQAGHVLAHKLSHNCNKNIVIELDRADKTTFSEYGPEHTKGRKRLRGGISGDGIGCTLNIPIGSIYVVDKQVKARYRNTIAQLASVEPDYRQVYNKGDIYDCAVAVFAITIDEKDNDHRPWGVNDFYKGGLTLAEQRHVLSEIYTRAHDTVATLRAGGKI